LKKIETIANAGNTELPCYLAVESLCFKFSKYNEKTDQELWVAENGELHFVASNQLELFGANLYVHTKEERLEGRGRTNRELTI